MYCIPTMRSDVWPQTSLAGLLNSAGLQTNFRHLGASQMAFVLLRCGRVGVGRPITYASELDYLYLHSMCNMYIIYIHICKYDFKYVCNICTSSIDSGTCTRIWSYVHMEGCGLGWAVNVCWELRTDLKLFQAGGTLPWCLQAHQNIKLLEVQAITPMTFPCMSKRQIQKLSNPTKEIDPEIAPQDTYDIWEHPMGYYCLVHHKGYSGLDRLHQAPSTSSTSLKPNERSWSEVVT